MSIERSLHHTHTSQFSLVYNTHTHPNKPILQHTHTHLIVLKARFELLVHLELNLGAAAGVRVHAFCQCARDADVCAAHVRVHAHMSAGTIPLHVHLSLSHAHFSRAREHHNTASRGGRGVERVHLSSSSKRESFPSSFSPPTSPCCTQHRRSSRAGGRGRDGTTTDGSG